LFVFAVLQLHFTKPSFLNEIRTTASESSAVAVIKKKVQETGRKIEYNLIRGSSGRSYTYTDVFSCTKTEWVMTIQKIVLRTWRQGIYPSTGCTEVNVMLLQQKKERGCHHLWLCKAEHSLADTLLFSLLLRL